MKSSNASHKVKVMDRLDPIEHGRAIARAMDEYKVHKEKNMAKAEKRRETMLHKAAQIEIGRNYS